MTLIVCACVCLCVCGYAGAAAGTVVLVAVIIAVAVCLVVRAKRKNALPVIQAVAAPTGIAMTSHDMTSAASDKTADKGDDHDYGDEEKI